MSCPVRWVQESNVVVGDVGVAVDAADTKLLLSTVTVVRNICKGANKFAAELQATVN